MKIGIVITAAGRGELFRQAGGVGNKLNASLGQTTVFARTLQQALATGMPVQVVTRPENQPVQQVCADYQVPCIVLKSAGLGETIAAGVAATREWDGWLIHLADMPFVPVDIFKQVAEAVQQNASQYGIVQPCYQHKPGHPVGFSAGMRDALCALTGDKGARELLRNHPVLQIALNLPAIVQDIDLPSHLIYLD